jgi:hypothetical protein
MSVSYHGTLTGARLLRNHEIHKEREERETEKKQKKKKKKEIHLDRA